MANPRQYYGNEVETKLFVFLSLDENSNLVPEFAEEMANLDIFPHSEFLSQQFKSKPILIAAPENFNPELIITPEPISPPKSTTPVQPSIVLETIETGFRSDISNVQQQNQIIEPVFQFRLANGEKIRVKTGFNSFHQSQLEPITNIHFRLVGKEKRVNILYKQPQELIYLIGYQLLLI
ncbi:hypothetical protein A0J48_017605 [Sphaerospermopsis aphanizomenoides BCCUSP55]|uniref:hypothetical protein n=1 Tax=Sphaerospermopsis aphanizomenoides TaxID=459663 RepID=UPI001908A276|nr:hypothetical protein [Sphaerospermopsis aphanizomenoides]MBK1989331.1 hypothetical protein [Sphaerospermopsis aphanizomenoides BCCUSP55]